MARWAPFNHCYFSVKAKISIGFSVVLLLHISIAVLCHQGLTSAKLALETSYLLRHDVDQFDQIDRHVSALQRNVLLFAFTGYGGPEVRVRQIQDELGHLLKQASLLDGESDAESLDRMHAHLASHQEIFDAVISDRAKRRKIVNEELRSYEARFAETIKKISTTRFDSSYPASEQLAKIEAAFRTAEIENLRFIIAPDSSHFRNAQRQLDDAIKLIDEFQSKNPDAANQQLTQLKQIVTSYDSTTIQMVQSTRGYLHLVNVVLAGELSEFRRLASEIRERQASRLNVIHQELIRNTESYQLWSNFFSALTIILGIIAAWVIGRSIAPPLNAIATTFDKLTTGESVQSVPGTGRNDELGRLANAAEAFKNQASETRQLLKAAEASKIELDMLNARLSEEKARAELMASEATAATTAKSDFLANMSHEIRTPMTAILGFTETISERIADDDDSSEIETIRRNGQHLLSVINDILDLSKIESGKMSVELVDCNPSSIVAETLSLVDVRDKEDRVEVHSRFNGQIPAMIRTDPTRLRQILINLVGNAIKFTESGQVELITTYQDDNNEPTLSFDVIDTGIGMSADQVKRLFQPFSQADTSTTRRYGGTGLGLTLSKHFAELLGGGLQVVRTELGEGTQFRLTIKPQIVDDTKPNPIQEQHADSTKPAGADIRIDGVRVLLAEDGLDNQRLLTFILKKAGAIVEVVENGLAAKEAILKAWNQSNSYGCVLMDMQMPILSGYDATRAVREEGYPGWIIALTAHAMVGDKELCLDAGCDQYLTKPVSRKTLVQAVFDATLGMPNAVSNN
ncbi:ATP-binding protein [Thalassoroseus pseudoceratinae]|uniref:ATP-binding protein n=1 Tax=Thalassoroseus pseudoceratinae TaxID=2713176 RepID=UPI001421C017|nr:ATP-binding protein [Thalassoroseus pseudoceratinae]